MNILLVEDDDAIALVVEAVLRKEGHRVERCVEGEAALAFTGARDLVLADVTLPGSLDGVELARRMRAQSPDLPVVLMSGAFDEDSPVPEGLPGVVLLPKPFRRAGLLEAIGKVVSF